MAPRPASSSPTTTEALAEAAMASTGQIISNHLHSTGAVPPVQGDLRDLLAAIRDLHRAMCSFSSSSPNPKSLLHAQHLLQQAAASLQEEFRRILEANRDTILDYDSTSSSLSSSASSLSDLDDVYASPHTVPTARLRSIAETMIAVGYTRECLAAYSSARRPVLEDNLRCLLGFDLPDPSHPHKPDRELASHRIRNWILAARPATLALFANERVLCDSILPGPIADSCFADVARDLAVRFFAFPELAVARARHTPPGAVFHLLDMHSSIARLAPEIDAIFASKSTSAVGSRARSTMLRLSELAGSAVAEFESAIHHDRTKSAPPNAGLHPLTSWAMEYLGSLADRAGSIVEILAEEPMLPSSRSILPDSPGASESPRFSTIHEDEEDVPIGVSSRMAWLLLVLLCKLDGKARLYKDAASSYLFLANNLDHIVSVVRASGLEALVGHEWVARHERKVRAFVRSFERLAWGPALEAAVPADGEASGLAEKAFEECWRRQVGLVVESAKLRGEIKESIAGKVLEPYRAAYEARGAVSGGLKPDEVRRRLEGLYRRSGDTGEATASASGGSGHGVDSKEIGSGSGSEKKVSWRSMLVKLTHRRGAR